MPTLPISEGSSLYFVNILSILTLKFGRLPISGKFCATEVACNFENLPVFLFESSLFSAC